MAIVTRITKYTTLTIITGYLSLLNNRYSQTISFLITTCFVRVKDFIIYDVGMIGIKHGQ